MSESQNKAPSTEAAEKNGVQPSNRATTKTRNGGGQRGNTNGLVHGAYSLINMRRRRGGRPPGNTQLGREFRRSETEYLVDSGGADDASRAQRQIANDNVWCDFIIEALNFEISKKRQLIRKGKPHPILTLRLEIAKHRRENYKLTGLKRVQKALTLDDILREADEADESASGSAPAPQGATNEEGEA